MFILEVEAEEYRRMFFKADTTVDVFNLLNTLFKNVVGIKSVTVTQEKEKKEGEE